MTLKEIIATGQPPKARTLVRTVKLYLEKRLDFIWGIVKEGLNLQWHPSGDDDSLPL